MKRCSTCCKLKRLLYFRLSKYGELGVSSKCIACKEKVDAVYRSRNRIKATQYARIYREKNKEKLVEIRKLRLWRIRKAQNKWRSENRERDNEVKRNYAKIFYARHKDALSDIYIRRALNFVRGGVKLRNNQIPQELIELKRNQLKLARLIKEKS